MQWLDAVAGVLDEKKTKTCVFFRDDDAPWCPSRLDQLLDCFARAELTLDVAVIPAELEGPAVYEMRAMKERYQQFMRVHQHGFCHENHQTVGRKCEFGDERGYHQQWKDISTGYAKLADCFDHVDRIFTPPWNRCEQETVAALEDLAFEGISRIAGSSELSCKQLFELPVNIDWEKKNHGKSLTDAEFANYISTSFRESDRVGLMFHHALMNETTLQSLHNLLILFKNNEDVVTLPMSEIIRGMA